MPVIYQKRICRDDLRRNPNAVYLFGDNEARTGLGGQAREMRGEPNAFGIATKKSPREFWSDEDYWSNIQVIDNDYMKIYLHKSMRILVVPSDGIGTGLSELKIRAPVTFDYLRDQMKNLIEFVWKRGI